MRENLHPAIRETSETIAKTGKFDDAIFAAFRYIEGEIQERIGSKSIGKSHLMKLLMELFLRLIFRMMLATGKV